MDLAYPTLRMAKSTPAINTTGTIVSKDTDVTVTVNATFEIK